MTPDIIYDQMIGMGLAKKVIFSYAGNPGVGLLRRMRDAIENEYPRGIQTVEHSHSAMAQAYEARASWRVVVTIEEIVPSFAGLHPNVCILPHWTIDAIAVVPGGAHPSYTH